MPPKARNSSKGAISAVGRDRAGSTSSTLARSGAALLTSKTPAAVPTGSAASKAGGARAVGSSPKGGRDDAEALELFERHQPDGKADGTLKLAQFAEVIREMNIKKMLIWGDETGPVVKEEWKKIDGFTKKEITLSDFTAWWPTFLEVVEARIAEVKASGDAKEAKAAAERRAKLDRCSGDGVWKIPLTELEFALDKAREKGKTALLIDNTENLRVETYAVYQNWYLIECKRWIMDKATKKASVEEILKAEQEKFFRAKCFKHGQTVVFRLATSACDLVNTFSSEIFPSMSLLDTEKVTKTIGVDNAANFKESPFYKMCPDDESRMDLSIMGLHDKFNVVVITQFHEEEYEGFLKDMVPLHLMQPIKPYCES